MFIRDTDVPKPTAPTFFTKGPDTVLGPYDDIAYDATVSAKWDYDCLLYTSDAADE